jgi:hypothetical protein
MSKVTEEPTTYTGRRFTKVAHLTSSGDGSERKRHPPGPPVLSWADTAVSQEEDEAVDDTGYGYGHAPAETVPYLNIQEIIPGLFIGDVTAAMDNKLLKEKNITVIIAASEYCRSTRRSYL